MTPSLRPGDVGCHLNLKQIIFPQLVDANRGSRRDVLAEIFEPYLVQLGQILVDIHDVAGRLEAMVEIGTAGFENGFQILQGLRRLLGEASLDDLVSLLGIPWRSTR